jgi:hypothetical protein
VSGKAFARAGLLAAAALLAFGCGSDDGAPDESQRLPSELADDLASQSDAVGLTLEKGDGCTARKQAIALRKEVKRAIDEGEVPTPLQREMQQRANDLVESIYCPPPPKQPPPPPPPPPTEDYEEEDD